MLAKPLLVFSSYALLFALLAVRIDYLEMKWVLGLLAALGVLSLLVLLLSDSKSAPVPRTVKTVTRPGPEAGGYLVSYLLPFVVSPTPTLEDCIAYAAFLLVAGVITAKTGAVAINPLLYLLGWQVIQLTDSNKKSSYLVTRKTPEKGEIIWVSLFDDVLVRRKAPVSSMS